MSMHVCSGATLQCSFGLTPSSLAVLPANRMTTDHVPAANIMDHQPLVNVISFGMCACPGNPAVAAATAAALGVLTPMPCIPNTPAPWVPGSPTVTLAGIPVLNETSNLACVYGGIIQILMPGQMNHTVP
jgi:hypothetical protein